MNRIDSCFSIEDSKASDEPKVFFELLSMNRNSEVDRLHTGRTQECPRKGEGDISEWCCECGSYRKPYRKSDELYKKRKSFSTNIFSFCFC